MARTKKQVVVAVPVPSNEKVADLLLEMGYASNHVEESVFGGTVYNTTVGKRILDARKSLKDGFTTSFFAHLKVVATTISRESNEVQDIFNSILTETYNAAATHELIVDHAATVAAKPQEVKNVGYVRQAYNK
jgi:hypothetical protein